MNDINIKPDVQPIRIAQFMTEMNYGGVEMVVMNYYRHIDRNKVQFDFFVLEGSEIPQKKEIEELGGRVYVLPHYKHLVMYEKELIRILKENNYKIVHSHMNTLSVFSLWGAKRAGVPVRIAHNHSTAGKGEYKKNIFKYVLRPFAKIYPTDLFACSQYAGEWLFGKKAKFNVLNNAIDTEKFAFDKTERNRIRKELSIEDKFVIGHVGRFCYQKNQEFLVELLHSCIETGNNDMALLLIGDKNHEAIDEEIKKYGLDKHVTILENRDDVNKLYSAMDIFVMPSRYEGLGMVVLEAQYNGLPVIVSKEVPDEAVICDNVTKLDLSLNKTSWLDKMCEIKCDNERNRSENKIIIDKYDINKEASKLTNFYIEKEEL